jgi:predicted DNA-binding protein
MSDEKPKKVQIRAFIEPELRQRFKTACTAKGKTMDDVITEFVEKYSDEYENELKGKK